VTRCNRLASLLEARVRELPDFELLAPASLSVVNFRYRPAGRKLDDAALDALNDRISKAVSESGEAHMPTTRVRGKTSLRACFLHYENDEGDVEHLVQLVSRLGAETCALAPYGSPCSRCRRGPMSRTTGCSWRARFRRTCRSSTPRLARS
jgi:glutamate/tyrosine decarboxylase-like PLP-dependent enzyme